MSDRAVRQYRALRDTCEIYGRDRFAPFARRISGIKHGAERGGHLPLVASEDELLEAWFASEAKCQLCKRLISLSSVCPVYSAAVDHSHETGKFRGWLCIPCNSSLGWAEHYRRIGSVHVVDNADLKLGYLCAG